MLDTVKLHSPYVSEAVAAKVTAALSTKSGYDNARDVLMYEIVGGNVRLEGSYDHRVRVGINRKKAFWLPGDGVSQRGRTIYEDCPPYLEVEGSVHKAMVGHNVYGGPMEIRRACTWMIADLDKRLGAPLPYADWWEVQRLDWACVYDLGSPEAVGDYLWAMGQAAYPRRRAQNYGRLGCFFAGDTTAVKFYHKGPEFRRHDYKRVRSAIGGGALAAKEIAMVADSRMRVEVSIKAPVLDKAFDKYPILRSVDESWAADVWEKEVQKVIREGRSDVEIVRRAAEVRSRLVGVYGSRRGAALYATWVSLSTVGEGETQGLLSSTTYYRHRSELVTAGCSWRSTDVQLIGAAPRFGNFVPTLVSPQRDVRVHPRVIECLAA